MCIPYSWKGSSRLEFLQRQAHLRGKKWKHDLRFSSSKRRWMPRWLQGLFVKDKELVRCSVHKESWKHRNQLSYSKDKVLRNKLNCWSGRRVAVNSVRWHHVDSLDKDWQLLRTSWENFPWSQTLFRPNNNYQFLRKQHSVSNGSTESNNWMRICLRWDLSIGLSVQKTLALWNKWVWSPNRIRSAANIVNHA